MATQSEPQSAQSLFFDPDTHPEDTKSFNEFCDLFVLRYNALYPDPPKVSLDTAITRWKLQNTTADNEDPKPTLDQYDAIRNDWRSQDKVTKFMGLFSSKRFHKDWHTAQQDENLRNNASWTDFIQWMRTYYKPTENPTLKNFHFRDLKQTPDETFTAFCNRVEHEASHCYFKCTNGNCTAESTATRDQIIIGTHYQTIREEALLKSWDLATLRSEGMKMESASKSSSQIGGETVNKLGKYSFKNVKQQPLSRTNKDRQRRTYNCFYCGDKTNNLSQHREICKGVQNKCSNCSKLGHLPTVCRSRNISKIDANKENKVEADVAPEKKDDDVPDQSAYNVNLFIIKGITKTKIKRNT